MELDYKALIEMWVQGNKEGVIESLEFDDPDCGLYAARCLDLFSEMYKIEPHLAFSFKEFFNESH